MNECHLNKGPLQTEHVIFEAVFSGDMLVLQSIYARFQTPPEKLFGPANLPISNTKHQEVFLDLFQVIFYFLPW